MPGEAVCRTACTQTGAPCKGAGDGLVCDEDHFCRVGCDGGGSACGGCAGTDVCDATVGVCRPPCADGCPMGWACVGLDVDPASDPAVCTGCRPLASNTFTPPTLAPIFYYDAGAGEATSSVAVGDLGSGATSVIAVDATAGKIWVYGNDGAGTLTPPVAYSAPGALVVAVVDLTRDGRNDLVVAAGAGVLVFPGNGDGTLGAALVGPAVPATRLVVGDFDGDGNLEVAFAGSGSGQISIVGSDGAGGVALLASFSGAGASYVRIGAGDYDGDGTLDLYADDERGNIDTWLNAGGTSLAFTAGPQSSFDDRGDSATFDVDGDGKPDLALIASARIVIGHDDAAAFATTGQIALPGATSLAAGDIDGDGHVDLTVADQAGSALHVLSGDGTTLVHSADVGVLGGPGSVALGDLDGDGMTDLVVGLAAGGVGVLLNQTPPP